MANVNLVLGQDLLDRVDAARGAVPRVRWIRRAIEAELAGLNVQGSGPAPPDPPRAVMQRSPRVAYPSRRDVAPFQRK
jgi:hypothetical protein